MESHDTQPQEIILANHKEGKQPSVLIRPKSGETHVGISLTCGLRLQFIVALQNNASFAANVKGRNRVCFSLSQFRCPRKKALSKSLLRLLMESHDPQTEEITLTTRKVNSPVC